MKKKTDRGFSLIELIIAIAILIILTGLLAPQFMKYIEKSRKAACLNNIDVMIQEYQVAMIENQDIKPEKVLEMMVKRGMKCPSKGEYSIKHLDDENFLVNCKVHGDGEAESTDPKVVLGKDVYERMLKFADEYSLAEMQKMFKEAGMNSAHITNDTIRQYLLKEVYGGQWPKADKSQFTGSKYTGDLYVQPYINVKNTSGGTVEETTKESVFAYIGPSSNDTGGSKWSAYFIYDPNAKKWYREPNGNSILIMNQDWDTVKANTIDKGWIPVE
ncbi:prepilin-type N-terminal cleavage/methylation domain-containing protein [uncultured Clostridium sp.]|uniref:prepilin-type N-terminal cleavage/methylation domain-containing protein n=1 Tax=uncultured Clostridium sp. TaxID=59620 RepID=UPI0025F2031D|nr:prepilin-type N-terminal cleavage/methylation domain-containing protein [uncultured Clostridium sp.]